MIGVFGGAFDPVHNAHKKIIDYALDTLCFSKIIIVPSFNSPHKLDSGISYDERIRLLECLYKDESRIIIEDVEKTLDLNKSYTYIVLEQLQKKYTKDKMALLIGGDSALSFDTWMNPQKICELSSLIVFPRNGNIGLENKISEFIKKYNADIAIININLPNCSSSEIKVKLQTGFGDLTDCLDDRVLKRIKEKKLYMNYRWMADKLRKEIGESRFEHSVRTALFGVKLAPLLKVSFEDAFIACLLHDCGKNIKQTYGCEDVNFADSVLHQYIGAIHANLSYGITNKVILDAIKWHATGKPNMHSLGQLVYCADKLEANRYFDGVEKLRKEIFNSFNQGFLHLLESNLNYLKKHCENLDILTLETYKWYNNQNNIT